ncbi:response regulator, partial [Rhizobium ruizarguesonis]
MSNSENQRFRILIVEDQPALRFVLSRLFEKLGHEVQAVEDGDAAIQKVDEFTPDMVFSDISMPGMSGYE